MLLKELEQIEVQKKKALDELNEIESESKELDELEKTYRRFFCY